MSVSVTVQGISAQASTAAVQVFGLVIPSQAPDYAIVAPSQIPGYAVVVPT